ncbi:hypothetical protein R70723_06800 [Paenibacillus sp. FSL R7-0273]|uniref:hypothetical protein n=1 Tax=Paenibacillus sp. FSL R7-0273 TaxID=1536772 RepID=UPI0004F589E9|nr:hypothetical protein [Paenibacillus sp. FSL R7-0273]AIQ45633.1 hypothetical protein R70723_06800 [Paenibacillus sp. FSL R7-0273]OMF95154.1 hypothetical protein BK144_06355 [Paenibacillus sp. FSL R7-0273]
MVRALKIIAYAEFVSVYIFGIIVGNTAGKYTDFPLTFNNFAWGIMLSYWIGGLLICVFILAFAAILDNLQSINLRVHNIEKELCNQKQPRSDIEVSSALALID